VVLVVDPDQGLLETEDSDAERIAWGVGTKIVRTALGRGH
jgi:hypothetical protein